VNNNWQKLIDLSDKYNALSLRERGVIGLLVIVVLFIAWNELIWSSQGLKQQEIEQQLASTQTQIDALDLQIKTLKINQKRDPDVNEKQQLEQLTLQERRLDEQLKKTMHGLIKPAQMAKVLEAVLTRQTDLKLYRVANLPTEDLLSVKNKQRDLKLSRGGVYKHGLQIEFRGSYLSMLDYLKALDDLPWEFYWDKLVLNVQQYPQSHISITVHTLSLDEGWIGV
jgi:MSHA biogenesis protein MshJ